MRQMILYGSNYVRSSMVYRKIYLYVLFVYDPPENSTFTKRIGYEILDLVKNDILKYSREGNIMIAGV